jgi:hypothetical protein
VPLSRTLAFPFQPCPQRALSGLVTQFFYILAFLVVFSRKVSSSPPETKRNLNIIFINKQMVYQNWGILFL